MVHMTGLAQAVPEQIFIKYHNLKQQRAIMMQNRAPYWCTGVVHRTVLARREIAAALLNCPASHSDPHACTPC
jgi:hypothetical protein